MRIVFIWMVYVSRMIDENNAREQVYYPLKKTVTNTTEEIRFFLILLITTIFYFSKKSPWSNEKTSLSLPIPAVSFVQRWDLGDPAIKLGLVCSAQFVLHFNYFLFGLHVEVITHFRGV